MQHKDFDVVAFETVPTLKEGQAIAHLLRTEGPGKPAWLTFNCKNETLLTHGEGFADQAVPLAFEVLFLQNQLGIHGPVTLLTLAKELMAPVQCYSVSLSRSKPAIVP